MEYAMNERTYRVLEYELILHRLAELTSCEGARIRAEELRPMTDIEKIRETLHETEDAVFFITRRGQPPIGGVKDIRPAVRRAAAGGTLSFAELLAVAGLLKACRQTLNYASGAGDDTDNRMARYIAALQEDGMLEERIYHCILSDSEMSDDASPALREIRRQIADKQSAIKDRLNELIHSAKYAKAIQEPVVTMRGERYCIPVKVAYRGDISGLVHDTSASGQTLFIEPSFVVESNNKIKELRVQEAQEIQRILAEFSLCVGEAADMLLSDLELVIFLDFTFAKARLSLDMKGIRPEINEEGRISILQGRHPAIPKEQAVPITFFIGDTFHTLVITGPNTGGKTVALKTVGLFTLMMQSGLLIPAAEKSVLSVFHGIYADIGDEQSIAQSLSTFSAHMRNIVDILRECDHRSLVLFDELGAGTDPTEGAALAMSILECVHQMGAVTVATTHYSELKVFAATTAGFENGCCEFDIGTLKPTYKLLIGIPGKSNAFAISQRLGLDSQIISRAKEFLSQEDLRFEDMLLGIEKSRSEIEADREEARRLRAESEQLRREIKLERDQLQQQRSALLMKSKEEAKAVLQKAKQTSERLLGEIRKAALEAGPQSVRKAEAARQALSELQSETDASLYGSYRAASAAEAGRPPETLTAGQTVRIVSLNSVGTVLEPPNKDGTVYVQAGILKVYLPLEDLRLEKNPEKTGRRYASGGGGTGTMKAATIQGEIDVRGMTVEEAVSVVDRQIHDGLMAKQHTFSVIHGKGTGALRSGIHKYLKGNRSVQSFRLGEYGEGDAGVTIVTLI